MPLYASFRTNYGGTITFASLKREEQMADDQPRVLEYEAAGASDQGRTRKSNEDAYGLNLNNRLRVPATSWCAMAWAARPPGEIASRLAVDAMLERHEPSEVITPGRAFQQAVGCGQRVACISVLPTKSFSRAGMGTTLVAMATRGNHAWVAHVGDSRCYRMRGGQLERLTHRPLAGG